MASNIAMNAANQDSYPLVASNEFGAMTQFAFDDCDASGNADEYLQTVPWSIFDYDVFPEGGSGPRYFSSYANVCPVGVGRDVNPTNGPTKAPSPSPTNPPTKAPVTAAPVEARSLAPVPSPTVAPTPSPRNPPRVTLSPVEARAPGSGPTRAPTPSNCETGFVYCPGFSQCFLDDAFNSGNGVVSHTGNPNDAWGWNIEYICGGTLHCEIWTGAQGCNFQKGRKVGTFEFNEHAATYSLFSGYKSNKFDFYAGQCESNDGGDFVTNGRWCLPSSIAENARTPESYTLGTNGSFGQTSSFTFSGSNEGRYLNEPWGENNYDVFPIGRNGRHWLTSQLEVCTVH
jgi:hypothetical protein